MSGEYVDHAATAPWTRPANKFVAPWGPFTAAEFALIARRHMEVYGTTREQLSVVAATIRNNGDRNPEAVFRARVNGHLATRPAKPRRATERTRQWTKTTSS